MSETKEAYKTLRTDLSFAGKNVKVISLTSCTPDEGKTSASFQLCLSLAESGKKTILVDHDLRKSVCGAVLEQNREKIRTVPLPERTNGTGRCMLQNQRQQFRYYLLQPIPPNPSELLGGDAFKNMLEVLRMKSVCHRRYAAVGSVIDGAVVGAICDGTVCIMKAEP